MTERHDMEMAVKPSDPCPQMGDEKDLPGRLPEAVDGTVWPLMCRGEPVLLWVMKEGKKSSILGRGFVKCLPPHH